MNKCKDCNNTGVAIVLLDDTSDIGIQSCDTCKYLTDNQVVKLISELLKINYTTILAKYFHEQGDL